MYVHASMLSGSRDGMASHHCIGSSSPPPPRPHIALGRPRPFLSSFEMYRRLIATTSRKLAEDDAATLNYGYGADGAEDYQPALVAFVVAGAIWVFIALCFVIVIVLQYIRERELINASGRGKEIDWTESLTRSMMMDAQSIITASEEDLSVRQSAVLDVRYNFQTLFLALFQASLSMLILGGIQLNFALTIRIVFYCVGCWTLILGILIVIWMSRSRVCDAIDGGGLPTRSKRSTSDMLLHEMKAEWRHAPFSVCRHFIEISFFKPLIDTSELSAGDIYQDLGRDSSRVFLLGCGQLILLAMYVADISSYGKPDLSNEKTYGFYCCGIVMQIAYLSGQDVLYKSMHSHLSFWGNVLRAARSKRTYTWEPCPYLLYHRPRMVISSGSVRGFDNEASLRITNNVFLWMRFVFSTIVNVGGLNVITLLLPLQLASSDVPLAFVMSAVGAYYILGIDDYNNPVVYKLSSTRNLHHDAKLGDDRVEMTPMMHIGHERSRIPSSNGVSSSNAKTSERIRNDEYVRHLA